MLARDKFMVSRTCSLSQQTLLVLIDPGARHPAVDLEDPALVGLLYRTFLGGAETVPEASRALPVGAYTRPLLSSTLSRFSHKIHPKCP